MMVLVSEIIKPPQHNKAQEKLKKLKKLKSELQ